VTRRRQPEQQLQRSLVEHLRCCATADTWFCHLANGGARTAVEGAVLKSMGVRAGAPDLLVIRAGQALFIELKTRGRKLSPAQAQCHEELRRAGAVVECHDSINAALAFLKRLGVLR
jgi:hypothetical protein